MYTVIEYAIGFGAKWAYLQRDDEPVKVGHTIVRTGLPYSTAERCVFIIRGHKTTNAAKR